MLAALLGMLAVAAPYLWTRLERRQVDALASRLVGETKLLGGAIPWDDGARLEDSCASLSTDLGLRITVLGAEGRVLCDSGRAAGGSAGIADAPEVRAALAGGTGSSKVVSTSASSALMYTRRPSRIAVSTGARS